MHPDSLCASSCRWKAHQYGSFQTVMAYASASSIRYVIILILLSHYPLSTSFLFPLSHPCIHTNIFYSLYLAISFCLFVCLLVCFFVLFFYNFLGSSDGPYTPAHRKKQYLDLGNCTTPSLANLCVVQDLFFFHHFFSHVRGAWRRIKTPLMLRITLIHGICIYTLPSNISSLIVKALEIITSRNPPRLLVHQCQLESSRQKTDASCDRTQSRLSNHLPFLLIKAITTPSPLREQEV